METTNESKTRRFFGVLLRVLILAVPLIVIDTVLGRGLHAVGVPRIVTGPVVAALLLAAYVWLVRRFEHRDAVELSRGPAVRELFKGAGYGAGMFTAILAVVAVLGSYHLDGFGSFDGMISTLGLSVMAGVFEELLIRGVLYRVLDRHLGTWWALGISAAVFGLLHIFNPGATIVSALAIALEAGVLLGLAYAATRRLWVPIGLHIAWNFTQSGIWGSPTSGLNLDGLLRAHLSGPAIISGGPFGIEGSLVTVIAGALLSAVFLRRVIRLRRAAAPVSVGR
jgi:membrane protease YdiL (CAAX protease family)